jgi:hypothetical protein
VSGLFDSSMADFIADAGALVPEPDKLCAELSSRGYIILPESKHGFGDKFRSYLLSTYFDSGLQRDYLSGHENRERLRAAVVYSWADGNTLLLRDHADAAILDQGGIAGQRRYRQVSVGEDEFLMRWVAMVLSIVPPNERQRLGSFGINFLRTRGKVVNAPHQENAQFAVVYVISRQGVGAETRLSRSPEPDAESVLKATLLPGDLIVFRDADYWHYVSPLTAKPGVELRRDALVCTIDYSLPST